MSVGSRSMTESKVIYHIIGSIFLSQHLHGFPKNRRAFERLIDLTRLNIENNGAFTTKFIMNHDNSIRFYIRTYKTCNS